MLGNYTELVNDYASKVYEEFLESCYEISPCSDSDRYFSKDEYKLKIDFLNSGYTTACEINEMPNDTILLEDDCDDDDNKINLYFVYKNTYITNNYTQTTVTGGNGYVFTQAAPSDTWVITNPLGYFPNVLLTDLSGQRMEAEVDIDPLNPANVTVKFTTPTTGKAFLS